MPGPAVIPGGTGATPLRSNESSLHTARQPDRAGRFAALRRKLVPGSSAGQSLLEVIEAVKGVNLACFSLALRDPSSLRTYISFCLRKYDELMGKGLPAKSPIPGLDPSDMDTLTVPLRFQTGGGTDPREILTLAAVTKLLQPKRIFEIGTYNGRTTAIFILNSSPECDVYTLDLPLDAGSLPGYIRPISGWCRIAAPRSTCSERVLRIATNRFTAIPWPLIQNPSGIASNLVSSTGLMPRNSCATTR